MKEHPAFDARGAEQRAALGQVTAPATRSTIFALAVPADSRRPLALGWLWLGVAALAGSGLFAILLVLARTPQLQHVFPVADFFRVALVVHVDLSVLVWFVAFAGMLWTLAGPPRLLALSWAGLALAALGTVALVAAAFVGDPRPVMANYVPVIDSAIFVFGLQMIAGASALLIARALLAPPPLSSSDGEAASLRFGLQAAALSGAIALATFVWSWMELPAELDPKAYYEMLFWGPGHVVQFTWTLLMLVGWLWLSGLVGAAVPLTPRMATVLFAIGLSGALIAPLIYLNWPVISVEHNRMFTWLMRFGGGLAILPLAMAITIGLLRAPATTGSQRPMRAALIVSMTLFAIGGAIGFTIKGSDVRIPAHYHGSIVGVTLALMGLAYAIAPRLSGRSLNWRLAEWQVYLYGAGQLLHIIGLVWSGGHGVQRKVAGSEQVLDTIGQAAGMGLMGLGGLIAVVGGVLFVVAMAGVLPPARFATAAGTARGARTGPASLPEQRR